MLWNVNGLPHCLSGNICSSGSAIERPQSYWMQLNIHTNDTLDVNNQYISQSIKLLTMQPQLEPVYDKGQWSINEFSTLKEGNWKLICLLLCINNVLAAFVGKRQGDTVTFQL